MASKNLSFLLFGEDVSASRAFKKVGTSAAEADAVVKRSFSGGTMLAAGGLIAGLGLAAEAATKFQGEMLLLQTQAGQSSESVKSMSKAVLGLAGTTGSAPEELATSLYHVVSTGLRGAQALDAVKIAAEGAKVGHADLEATTNALTSAIASGIPGVEDMSSAMGSLNAIVGAGDMKMQDLNDALGSGVLTVVKGYGVTLNDVGAALATFGDNNIRGADAATMLRLSVQALAVPAKTGAEVLKSMGLSMTDLRTEMSQHGLTAAVGDLVAHLKAAGVQSNELGGVLTQVFGKKAGPGIAVMVSQFDRLQTKVEEVSRGGKNFGQSWNDWTKSNQGQIDLLKGKVEAFEIEVGNKLLPILNSTIGFVNKNATALIGLGVGILGLKLAIFGVKLATDAWNAASKIAAGTMKLLGLSATEKTTAITTSAATETAAVETSTAAQVESLGVLDAASVSRGAAAATQAAEVEAAAAAEAAAVETSSTAEAEAMGAARLAGLSRGTAAATQAAEVETAAAAEAAAVQASADAQIAANEAAAASAAAAAGSVGAGGAAAAAGRVGLGVAAGVAAGSGYLGVQAMKQSNARQSVVVNEKNVSQAVNTGTITAKDGQIIDAWTGKVVKAKGSMLDLTAALGSGKTVMDNQSVAVSHLGGAQAAAKAKVEGVTVAQSDMAKMVQAAKDSMDKQAAAAVRLSKGLAILNADTMDIKDAQLQFRDAEASLTDGVKQNGKSLDDNTVKGRSNVEAMLAAIKAAQSHATAIEKSGKSASTAGRAYMEDEAALRKAAHAAGLNTQQVDALIKKYGGIPKDVATLIKTEDADARAKIAAFKSAVANLPKSIQMAVQVGGITTAEYLLQNLARSRTATVTVQTVGGGVKAVQSVGGKQAFASGTDYAFGGDTLVGEQGPERVILPKGARVESASRTRMGTTGDLHLTIHLNQPLGTPDSIAKAVVPALATAYRNGMKRP